MQQVHCQSYGMLTASETLRYVYTGCKPNIVEHLLCSDCASKDDEVSISHLKTIAINNLDSLFLALDSSSICDDVFDTRYAKVLGAMGVCADLGIFSLDEIQQYHLRLDGSQSAFEERQRNWG